MTAEGKISNYEKMKDDAAAAFLRFDQEEMIRKFALEHDKMYLYICFAGKRYRISRTTGAVSRSDAPFQAGSYNEVMTIYDVLCYSKGDCRLAGEWINAGSLSVIQGGALAKGSNFFQNAGGYFAGKSAALACACKALQGRETKPGDVAYELELFPFLPLVLRFWEADEDFPASLQIFVDRNILAYMHYETLMFALTHLLSQMRCECEKLAR